MRYYYASLHCYSSLCVIIMRHYIVIHHYALLLCVITLLFIIMRYYYASLDCYSSLCVVTMRYFTKTGSGQTYNEGKAPKKRGVFSHIYM